jgi:hypothetical protein
VALVNDPFLTCMTCVDRLEPWLLLHLKDSPGRIHSQRDGGTTPLSFVRDTVSVRAADRKLDRSVTTRLLLLEFRKKLFLHTNNVAVLGTT